LLKLAKLQMLSKCQYRKTGPKGPIFNLIFSESTCSGVSKISNFFLCEHFWVNKSLSMMGSLNPFFNICFFKGRRGLSVFPAMHM
jgi:hypothetical protein